METEIPQIPNGFLADPFAVYLLVKYETVAKKEGTAGAVEFLTAFFEDVRAEPGREEIFWLALARAQLDHPPLLTEVRERAWALLDKVFETAAWKDGSELEKVRRGQIDRLRNDLRMTEGSAEILEDSKRARARMLGHAQGGRMEKALALSRESVKLWPKDENFTLLEAQFLAQLDRPGDAIDLCHKALRRRLDDPSRFAFLNLLGRLHIFLEQRQQQEGGQANMEGPLAVKYLKQAQKLFPGEEETLRLLAKAQLLNGKAKAAIENLDHLLGLNSDDPWLWKQKGAALEAQGKKKEAGEAFYKSVFFGGDAESVARQAWILMRQRKYEDSKRGFQRALEMAPYYPWASQGLVLNELSNRPGWTGWMVRHEIFWWNRDQPRFLTYMGCWLAGIITGLFFLGPKDPLMYLPIAGGGAVMLAGLFLPSTWTWFARRSYEKKSGIVREKPRAGARKKEWIGTGIGLVLAGLMIYLQKSGKIPSGKTPMESAGYIFGPLLPLAPWAVVYSVLSNRRQKFSDITWPDRLVLTYISLCLACFIPLYWTENPLSRHPMIIAGCGVAGLLLLAPVYYLYTRPRK